MVSSGRPSLSLYATVFGIYGIEEGLRINRSHSTFLSFAEILKKLESAVFRFVFIF